MALLDENRDNTLLRVSRGKLDDPSSKRHKPCIPVAQVEERFSCFFEDSDDESDGEDDGSAVAETTHQSKDVLRALDVLGRARDQQLAGYMEPLVGEGAAAAQDAAGGPDLCRLAMDLVDYDEEVMPAMKYVFGNSVVCPDSETARRATFD